MNGNGEEQNNHLEEFDFQPKALDFKENEEVQHEALDLTKGNSATNRNILYSERNSYPNLAVESWNCATQTQGSSQEIKCLSNNISE